MTCFSTCSRSAQFCHINIQCGDIHDSFLSDQFKLTILHKNTQTRTVTIIRIQLPNINRSKQQNMRKKTKILKKKRLNIEQTPSNNNNNNIRVTIIASHYLFNNIYFINTIYYTMDIYTIITFCICNILLINQNHPHFSIVQYSWHFMHFFRSIQYPKLSTFISIVVDIFTIEPCRYNQYHS